MILITVCMCHGFQTWMHISITWELYKTTDAIEPRVSEITVSQWGAIWMILLCSLIDNTE